MLLFDLVKIFIEVPQFIANLKNQYLCTMKYVCLLCIFLSFQIYSQTHGDFHELSSLPSILEEVSGIDQPVGSELLYMINDGGNAAVVYGYDIATKKIVRKLVSPELENYDWEDLTSDNQGNLYIGDFGNNKNKRKNLAIYTLTGLEGDSLQTTITRFRFEDQTKFPPKKKDRNYDVEAFIFLNNNFYLFTRNRSSKFDGTTKLYKVPAKTGVYVAELIGNFVSCKDSNDCQITAAAINIATKTIALLSYNKVWLLSEYTDDSFFDGRIEKIHLGHKSQKESITFKNNRTLLIADERTKKEGGNLYELRLKKRQKH